MILTTPEISYTYVCVYNADGSPAVVLNIIKFFENQTAEMMEVVKTGQSRVSWGITHEARSRSL